MSLFSTFNAMTSGAGGLPNLSLSFDGATNYLQKTYANFGTINPAKWTVNHWFKATTDSVLNGIFELGESPNRAIEITMDNNNHLDIRTSKNGSSIDGRLVTSTTYAYNNFYQIAVYFDSSLNKLELWVNGSKVTSFSTNIAPTGAVYSSPDVVSWGLAAGQRMHGLIFQPCFINNNNPSIDLLYNGGQPTDVSTITGLFSLLNTNGGQPLTTDFVSPNPWINNNGVITSSIIP